MGSSKPSRDAVPRRPAARVWAHMALVGLARVIALLAVLMGGVAATPAELNEAGRAAYTRGDFAAAEALFSQAIAQSPRDPLLHYHRAIALTQLGRFEEAIREHETVLRLRAPASLADLSRQALRGLAGLSGRRGTYEPGYGEKNSAVVGTWVFSMEIMGAEAHLFLVIKSDNTFEQRTELGFPPRFYLADHVLGTWTATADSITMTRVTCKTTNEPFGVLEATACKPATTMPINISGDVWTILDEGGREMRFRRT